MTSQYYVYPSDVVSALRPNISFSIGNSYQTLILHTEGATMPTEAEYNAKNSELTGALPLNALREQRNVKLGAQDWRTLRHASGGVTLTSDWVTYMQNLRDLPATQTPTILNGALAGITWPTEPTS